MKKYRKFALIILLCAVAVLTIIVIRGGPSVYSPTTASAQWLLYTSDENGFSIKYPPTGWNLRQYKDTVSFSSGELVTVKVTRVAEPMQTFIDKVQTQPDGTHSGTTYAVEINGLHGRRTTNYEGSFGGGTSKWQMAFLPRGDTSYVVEWSRGPGFDKHSSAYEAVCREIVGTFGFVEVRHRDKLTYADPISHFSFEYPGDWQLTAGPGLSGGAGITHGSAIEISVMVMEESTFGDFQKRQGRQVEDVGVQQEYFAHHLVGRRCLYQGCETYAFEKRGNVFIVKVWNFKKDRAEPRKVVDGILDSLTL